MRILITGICGFVGSTTARALLRHGGVDEIIGLDNLIRRGSERNRQTLGKLGVRVIYGDMRCASDVDNLPAADWVLDAAANPSVLGGVTGDTSSRQLMEHNLLGTINLLEYCKRHQAGLVVLSTSRVYSISPLAAMAVEPVEGAFRPSREQPEGVSRNGISETFSTNPPLSLYGSTKLASELLALEYGHAFSFPVWINRCGVMAGAGQFGKADQGIFSYWLHSWREGKPLRYIGFGGQGFQVRDCLHPRDLASLILSQMRGGMDPAKPRVVNVSGGAASARSLAQISAWCVDRWGARTVQSDPAERPFDLPWVVLDHALASNVWNWQPETSVTSVLTEIAEFADEQPGWLDQCAGS